MPSKVEKMPSKEKFLFNREKVPSFSEKMPLTKKKQRKVPSKAEKMPSTEGWCSIWKRCNMFQRSAIEEGKNHTMEKNDIWSKQNVIQGRFAGKYEKGAVCFRKASFTMKKISYNVDKSSAEKCYPKQNKCHLRKYCFWLWNRCHLFQGVMRVCKIVLPFLGSLSGIWLGSQKSLRASHFL